MIEKEELFESGFTILNGIYSKEEVTNILYLIDNTSSTNETFRRSKDLFAIRQFLKEIPDLKFLLFNDKLKAAIHNLLGANFFLVKSIFFNKPENSNWFVSYHQDLTISVDKKLELENYGPWTTKQNQFAVQPPLEILNSIYTIRIHLDDTDENNGALKIIPKSHTMGVLKSEDISKIKIPEIICKVKCGGIMFMRPLLLHSSNRSVDKRQRRVIHIELSNANLEKNLHWAEKETIL
jgi:ectoine hydroxylase-related dioxygenase (phytanoyl-CoA dioxygenase family)